MGIDNILEREPMYAGELERAREQLAHERRQQQRIDNAGGRLATPDGGVAVEESSSGSVSLSLGDAFAIEMDDYEPFIAGLLVANTALTAAVLVAVIMSN